MDRRIGFRRDLHWLVAADSSPMRAHQHGASARGLGRAGRSSPGTIVGMVVNVAAVAYLLISERLLLTLDPAPGSSVPGMTTAAPLTISDLAAVTGLRPDTVRYYERVGLMPAPARTTGDHRRYDALAVDRLRFIRGAQRLGLRLADIRNLLAVRDTGECPCEPAEPMLRARIAEIDAEMERLGRLRADLVAMAEQLPSATCPDPVPGTWCPPDHPKTEGRCDACSI